MPPYSWLHQQSYDPADIQASLRALKRVGVPYSDEEITAAPAAMAEQARGIVDRLAQAGITTEPDKEIVAVIAYLQRLGKDGRAAIAGGRSSASAPPATGSATP
jgi:cytochrome c oxidase cbb3-type subunit I/II